eukprot:scaffold55877_cov26-Tisochrysis_lutea.AAC.4
MHYARVGVMGTPNPPLTTGTTGSTRCFTRATYLSACALRPSVRRAWCGHQSCGARNAAVRKSRSTSPSPRPHSSLPTESWSYTAN